MKLDIFESRGLYRVSWFDHEDGEGAVVGQDAREPIEKLRDKKYTARRDRTEEGWCDFEYLAVEIAAQEWAATEPPKGWRPWATGNQ